MGIFTKTFAPAPWKFLGLSLFLFQMSPNGLAGAVPPETRGTIDGSETQKELKSQGSVMEFHDSVKLDHPLLQKRIYFWKKVFSWYTREHVILHHKDFPWIVYKVIHLPVSLGRVRNEARLSSQWDQKLRQEIGETRRQLWQISEKMTGANPSYTSDERSLIRKFKDLPSLEISQAAQPGKFRVQRGMKEDFEIALKRSRKFIPGMERIFLNYGLPPELARLPFIESMFDRYARSSVGAVGLWQLMPETARMYGLTVAHHSEDERTKPLEATRAAARFLKDYFRIFDSWPLAITAYNHGVRGVKNAVSGLSTTDLNKIIHWWQGRQFGFAAQNFFAEFMAVVELEKFPEQWLGIEEPKKTLSVKNG